MPDFADAYATIPVLAKEYPSREALIGVQPDFVYAAYSSAFEEQSAGARADLAKIGANSYTSPAGCPKEMRPKTIGFATVYGEIRDIGRIFVVTERAEQLIARYQAQLKDTQATIGTPTTPLHIFWYDSEDPPSAGACCYSQRTYAARGRGQHLYGGAGLVGDPDTIVLVDASWSTAADKRTLLTDNQAYAIINAVKTNAL